MGYCGRLSSRRQYVLLGVDKNHGRGDARKIDSREGTLRAMRSFAGPDQCVRALFPAPALPASQTVAAHSCGRRPRLESAETFVLPSLPTPAQRRAKPDPADRV